MVNGDCPYPGKQGCYDHTVNNNDEISCAMKSPRRGLVGLKQNLIDHDFGLMPVGSESETQFSSLPAFCQLSLSPKFLPSKDGVATTDERSVASIGKRTRSFFETPSSCVSNMGRPTTIPVPPPLKPICKTELTEFLETDESVHRLPILGEFEEVQETRRQGGFAERQISRLLEDSR
jgi:hypothetical protein